MNRDGTIAEMGNGRVETAGQLEWDGNIRKQAQGFQIVELPEQFLGAQVGKFLLDFRDIKVQGIAVIGGEVTKDALPSVGSVGGPRSHRGSRPRSYP